MSYKMSCGCQDLLNNFYQFQQIDRQIFLKSNNQEIYANTLLKLKEVEEIPISPFINNGNIYLFNYDKGFEIHSITTGARKFIDIRGITAIIKTDDKLYLEKIIGKKMIVFEAKKHDVVETNSISESTEVLKYNNYILFYRIYRNKSFLLNTETSETLELKNFDYESNGILKFIIKDDKIIVFYVFRNKKQGVYIYDIKSGTTNFYFDFSEYSAYGAEIMDIMDFEFNTVKNEEQLIKYQNYAQYLYFIYKKFGLYASMYYLNENEITESNFKDNFMALNEFLHDYRKRICKFPQSNEEYKKILFELKNAEFIIEKMETEMK